MSPPPLEAARSRASPTRWWSSSGGLTVDRRRWRSGSAPATPLGAGDHRGEARGPAGRLGRGRGPDSEELELAERRILVTLATSTPGRWATAPRRSRRPGRIASWANLNLSHEGRDHRPRVRGPAARGGLRGGGHDVIGLDVDRARGRARSPGESDGRGRALGAPRRARGERLTATTDHGARRLRRRRDLRPDPARQPARARPRYIVDCAAARWRRSCARASSWCWSRRPIRHHPRPPAADPRGVRAAAGTDFHLAFSPERIDPGRTDYTIRTTPKLVGGLTDACRERAVELYSADLRRGGRRSPPRGGGADEAPGEHLPLGQHRAGQRARDARDRMGIDIWEVVDAAATKPFGFMRFEPGPGMGGHCLPVDPFYLAFKAREYDFPTEFIELAGKINQHQPHFCVDRIVRALNDVAPGAGSRVLLLGVSYKAGVGDLRESPALKIAELLRELGAEVSYHDPHVPEVPELGLPRRRSPRRSPPATSPAWSPRTPRSTTRRSSPARRWSSTSAASPAGSRPQPGAPLAMAPFAVAERSARSMDRSPRAAGSPRRRREPSSGDSAACPPARCAPRRTPSRPAGVIETAEMALLSPGRPLRRTRSRSRSRVTRRPPATRPSSSTCSPGSSARSRSCASPPRASAAGWWPFGNVRLGGRHIHHFVPGILIAFGAGGAGAVHREREVEETLAVPFGAGIGLTFDEAALLLDLRDVYWTREGVLSVQLSLGLAALLGGTILALRMLRRGEARSRAQAILPPACDLALGRGRGSGRTARRLVRARTRARRARAALAPRAARRTGPGPRRRPAWARGSRTSRRSGRPAHSWRAGAARPRRAARGRRARSQVASAVTRSPALVANHLDRGRGRSGGSAVVKITTHAPAPVKSGASHGRSRRPDEHHQRLGRQAPARSTRSCLAGSATTGP